MSGEYYARSGMTSAVNENGTSLSTTYTFKII